MIIVIFAVLFGTDPFEDGGNEMAFEWFCDTTSLTLLLFWIIAVLRFLKRIFRHVVPVSCGNTVYGIRCTCCSMMTLI